jgi:DNA primase
MAAVDYLSKLTGDVGVADMLEYRKKEEKRKFIEQNKEEYIHPDVNEESLLRHALLRSDFFRGEGFSLKTLDYFEVAGGYKTKQDKLIRDIIPIRNTEGRLVAYSLRDIRPNASYESKYRITSGFSKDGVLYNLHRIIPTDKPIIVVEGFKSVWRLWDYGIKNVVAVMGSDTTQGQKNLLCSYALHGIVIFFDNDEAGAIGTVKNYETLSSKMEVRPVFITEVDDDGKGLDPADLDKDTIYGYLKGWI